MKVTSLLRYSRACPFLGHSTASSLRTLASTGSSTGANALTAKAIECPMMGPRLASKSQARAYAHVAGNREVEEIHKVSVVVLAGAELFFNSRLPPKLLRFRFGPS